jgi:hypothetical protein
MYNPVKTIKTNTLGTINMLGLARRLGAKILIASTSEVYGNPDPGHHPQVFCTYFFHIKFPLLLLLFLGGNLFWYAILNHLNAYIN